jgi:hypothetical protein
VVVVDMFVCFLVSSLCEKMSFEGDVFGIGGFVF